MAKKKKRRVKRKTVVQKTPAPGQPGYRSRPGTTGYDPMDTCREAAFAQGLFLRKLFTGQLRTRNLLYIALMIIFGIALLLPLVATMNEFLSAADGQSIACSGPLALGGLALLVNAAKNIRVP